MLRRSCHARNHSKILQRQDPPLDGTLPTAGAALRLQCRSHAFGGGATHLPHTTDAGHRTIRPRPN